MPELPMRAAPRPVRPLALRLHQLLDRAVGGVPQVDRVPERHAEHVVRRPVEEVEVVVVEELRRVAPATTLGGVAAQLLAGR